MESLQQTHHKEPISSRLPSFLSAFMGIEPTTDHWNPPLIQSVMSNFSENTPTYTCLEPVYPETSYAPSSTQYFPSSSTTTQPLYSSRTMSPVDQPLLHTALYRDVDQNQTARDEGLGSSPSSFSSTTPPHQANFNGLIESSTSSNNFDYSHLNTSSTPESTMSSIYSPECSKGGNRNDFLWDSNSMDHLWREFLSERPVGVRQASPVLEVSSKRKRSVTTKKICGNCETTVTPEWRWSKTGNRRLCNACQNYEYRNQIPRPKHKKNENIKRRNRKPIESRSNSKVKSSSRKNAKKSTSQTTLSPQYIPNDMQPTYNLPTYNTLPVRDFSFSNNTHMLPTINNQTFYAHFRPEMYIYNSVVPTPNGIINIAQGLPSNIPFSSEENNVSCYIPGFYE